MDWSLFFDPSLFRLTLVVAAPVLLASLGEVLIERSGVLNVAIEGMMLLGASAGFLAAYRAQSNTVGVLVAMATTALVGLVLAVCCVTLRASQLTVGLALFVFSVGLSSLLYRLVIGVRTLTPKVTTYGAWATHGPDLVTWLGRLPIPVYVALALVVLVHVVLFHTPFGLRLRACGENPLAAESHGIPVFAFRYGSVLVGSALIGAGGALLPLLLTGTYTDLMVGGRGWIALMLVIFGRWTPFGVLLGAVLFGYVEALQYSLTLRLPHVPPQFLLMIPYLFVIIVALRAYRGAQAPAALMKPYDREQRG
jgi:simple sugar transport system permease protein